MPSPPFIDYDSDNEKFSNLSEWEYDHDAYWDQDAPRQRKRNDAREDTININDEPKKQRRRVDYKKNIPGPSLEGYNTAAPTVIWRSKHDQLSRQEEPIFRTGQGEKVALLKDWKERFKCQPNLATSKLESKRTNRRGSQIATAVVIGEDPIETYNSTTLRPATVKKAAGLPSRGKASPYTAVNGTMPHTSDSELVSGGRTSNKLVRASTMAGKKRNIDELPNHEENELPSPNKRLGRPTKKTTYNLQTSKQPLAKGTNSSIPASRKRKADYSNDPSIMSPRKRTETTEMKGLEASASEGNGLANRTNSSIAASRKRKADDTDDPSITSPRKRTDTAKTKGVEASAAEGNGSPTKRTTRRNR